MGSTDAFAFSMMFFTPIGALGIALAMLGRPWARRLRWLWVPHMLTVLLAWEVLPLYFWQTTILGVHPCDATYPGQSWGLPTEDWHRAYSPSLLLVFLFGLAEAIWFWRVPRNEGT